MLANYEKYSDKPRSLDIQVGGETVNMDVDGAMFDVDDFERKFDVVIGSTDTLPQAGKARNQAIIESVGMLVQMGPILAPAVLEVIEVPEKETIRAALEQHFGQQSQNKPPDPAQLKAMENKSDVQKRFSESLSDGLEDFAKRKEVDPASSLRALQYIQAGANGQPIPDVGELITDTTGIVVNQPGAAQQGQPAPNIPGGMQ
jgi:hypothetical protein